MIFKFFHGLYQGFNTIQGHGIVNGSAETAYRPVSFNANKTL